MGVKPSNKKFPDLALITSDTPCTAAAVFTQNKFAAAPVRVSREALQHSRGDGLRAIIVNSGCANAATGKGGLDDALSIVKAVDSGLAAKSNSASTLVMSTGVIGQRLPIAKIIDAIPNGFRALDSSHDSWLATARAICTTDTFPKLMSTSFSLPSSPNTFYSLAGMTKGAGMIHPNMATLLGIMCTDASIPAPILKTILKSAMDKSFNAISIDGDTSTNDTVALLANGAAGGDPVSTSEDIEAFQSTLTDFSQQLAQLVVRDGEGATKFVCIRVANAENEEGAKLIASTIARSPLVKTALYGKDANWGRILCAVGNAQPSKSDEIVMDRLSISFVPTDGSEVLHLLVSGEPQQVDEKRAAEILAAEDLEIQVNLDSGSAEAKYWTCDFSHEYVTINGDYRT